MASTPSALQAFCCYPSSIQPDVELLGTVLRQNGIDAWLKDWEILPGDSVIGKLEAALRTCQVALIFFPGRVLEREWFQAEVEVLITQHLTQGKRLIPVLVGEDAEPPLLLSRLCPVCIDDHQAVLEAIQGRVSKPPMGPPRPEARVHHLCVRLEALDTGRLRVSAELEGEGIVVPIETRLSPALTDAWVAFQAGHPEGVLREQVGAQRAQSERILETLGTLLGSAVFPAAIASTLDRLIRCCALQDTVELAFETTDPGLLSLPLEAVRLPDGRILALEPNVQLVRRSASVRHARLEPLAGPLRILVAIGAPDERHTASSTLDHEREVHVILDAVDLAGQARPGQLEVHVLEVSHPSAIAAALKERAYHVLHLSGHGSAEVLELEDEEGLPCPTRPEVLADALSRADRPLPLIFLGTCLSGVGLKAAPSFAQRLLEHGVPLVVAMQARVSDGYATELAGAFYRRLGTAEAPLVSRALALARAEVERARRKALARGEQASPPEYATSTLFSAVAERPILDRGLPMEAPAPPALRRKLGQLSLLKVDELIGRKSALRRILGVLRHQGAGRQDGRRQLASQQVGGAPASGGEVGVVLTGMGGLGKSALAGRVAERLHETGWLLAAVVGPVSASTLFSAVGIRLKEHPASALSELGARLLEPGREEEEKLCLLERLLSHERLLLILDNFEDNLTVGGGAWRNEVLEGLLARLLSAVEKGGVLLTCRYPLPSLGAWVLTLPLEPLSAGETRKLLKRLEGIQQLGAERYDLVLRGIGGHPRMLEYFDALLRGGRARLPEVTARLEQAAQQQGISLMGRGTDADEAHRRMLQLGAADILLDELLWLAEGVPRGLEVLQQAAVSDQPIAQEALAYALAGGPEWEAEGEACALGPTQAMLEPALETLERLSLISLLPEGVFVHRWTAAALKGRLEPAVWREYARRAGEAWCWRAKVERSAVALREAVRALLAAEAWERAQDEAVTLIRFLDRYGSASSILALAGEVLERLPESARWYPGFKRDEGDAWLKLGDAARARRCFEQALDLSTRRVQAEPGRADLLRDLGVSCERLGDVLWALGQVEEARALYQKGLELSERLVQAEPGRADLLRDLWVSYNKLGDVLQALGQAEEARALYQKGLELRERLVQAEPGRADLQLDLVAALVRVPDYAPHKAEEALQRALAILLRLQAEGRLPPRYLEGLEALEQMLSRVARVPWWVKSLALGLALLLWMSGRLVRLLRWVRGR